jgi:hypothetical protein
MTEESTQDPEQGNFESAKEAILHEADEGIGALRTKLDDAVRKFGGNIHGAEFLRLLQECNREIEARLPHCLDSLRDREHARGVMEAQKRARARLRQCLAPVERLGTAEAEIRMHMRGEELTRLEVRIGNNVFAYAGKREDAFANGWTEDDGWEFDAAIKRVSDPTCSQSKRDHVRTKILANGWVLPDVPATLKLISVQGP